MTEQGVRSDVQFLSAVADGDRAALQELHRRRSPRLTLRLGRPCAAVDVVDQAVRTPSWLPGASFGPGMNDATWHASPALMLEGHARFQGTPAELAATADGRVWESGGSDRARLSWRTGDGRFRRVGEWSPRDVELVEPSIGGAYLLLTGGAAGVEAVGA